MRQLLIVLVALVGCSDPGSTLPPPVTLSVSSGTVAPGAEEVRCVDIETPPEDHYVSGFTVTRQAVHHTNLWRRKPGTASTKGVYECPPAPIDEFVLDAAGPFDLDTAAVFHFPARTLLTVDMHVLNTTRQATEATVEIVFHETDRREPVAYGFDLRAGNVPAPVQAGATVAVTLLAPPEELTLYALIGHQHAHGVLETMTIGSREVYRNESWSEPLVLPTEIHITRADRIEWSCTVRNTSTRALEWGQNAVQTAEMCSLFGVTDKYWDAVGTLVP